MIKVNLEAEEIKAEGNNVINKLQIALESVDPNKYLTIHAVHNAIQNVGQHFHSENIRYTRIRNDHKAKLMHMNNYTDETKGHIKKVDDLIDERVHHMSGLDHLETSLSTSTEEERHHLMDGVITIRDNLAKNSESIEKLFSTIEKCHSDCEKGITSTPEDKKPDPKPAPKEDAKK